ncbi:MAG TPA: YfhO family protein [Rhodocyclaceae bacterium]|nr:YfhO family protein [Rhodocyclaceae bacterium]
MPPTPAASRHFLPSPADLGCLALFAAVALFLYRRPLFAGDALYFRDFQIFFAPMKQFLGESLRAGHLPFWNPFVQMGVPFLADPQSGVLYPPSLIFLFADAPRGMALSVALHLVIGQAGCYALARHYGFARLPAAAGALVYGLGGWMVSSANMLTLIHSAAWAPWTLRTCERLWASPRAGTLAAAAAILALQMLAGWPEMFILLAFVLAVRRLATPGVLTRAWLPAQAAAGLIAAGLFAPQFLATWEAYRQSVRVTGLSPEQLFEFSATPGQWRSLLFPPALSQDNWNILTVFPDGHVPIFLSLYLGWAALALVAAGLAGPRRHALSWLAVIAVGVFFALGPANPLAAQLLGLANRFRSPEKYLFLVHLGAAMLAAAGAGRLLAALPARFGRIAGPALLAVLAAELLITNGRIDLLAPPGYYALGDRPEARLIAWDPGRVYARSVAAEEVDTTRELYAAFRAALTPNLGAMAGLSYVDGITFIQSRDQDLVLRLLDLGPSELLARRLGFLGTPYIITDDPAFARSAEWSRVARQLTPRLWRLEESAPLVGFPGRIVAAPDDAIARLSAQPEYARGETVFVAPGSIPPADGLSGTIGAWKAEADEITAEVSTATGGLVVVRENAYPGWRVTVDGSETAVVPADRFFLGVRVPPGQHHVAFRFTPTYWWPGLAVAALAGLVLLALVVVASRRPR